MLSEVISAQYWFADPGAMLMVTPFFVGLLVMFGALILAGLVMKIWIKKGNVHPVSRKFVRPIPGRLFRWGALGILLLFFRFEGASYLDWRFWWLVFGVWIVFVVAREVRFVRRERPERMRLWEGRGQGKEWEVAPKKKKGKKKKRR